MNCFNHAESAAVGMCKHCCKGVCSVCVVDTGDGLACEGKCAEHVRTLNRLISNNMNATNAFKFGRFLLPVFFISMGGVLTASTLIGGHAFKPIDLIGCIFIIMGIAYLIYNLKVAKPLEKDN
jgi:hypothetical protein